MNGGEKGHVTLMYPELIASMLKIEDMGKELAFWDQIGVPHEFRELPHHLTNSRSCSCFLSGGISTARSAKQNKIGRLAVGQNLEPRTRVPREVERPHRTP